MLLARSYVDAENKALIGDQKVDFGTEATTGASQRMCKGLCELRRRWTGQLGNLVRMFPRPCGRTAGANDRGIDKPEVVAQAAALFQVSQQMREDLGPGTVTTPTSEAAIDGLPRAIPIGDVPPGSTGMQAPQNTVKEALVILQRTAAPTVVSPMRKESPDALPLIPRKFVAMAQKRSPEKNVPALELGSVIM
jgi:hypothetical protein